MKRYNHCGNKIENTIEGIYQYETTHSNSGSPTLQVYNTKEGSGQFIVLNKRFNTDIFEKDNTYCFYFCEECGLVKISDGNKLIWNKRYYN